MAQDFLLDENNDLIIKDGDFLIGESDMQEVGIIIKLNPGELKSDPILGAGLIRLVKSNASKQEVENAVKYHLKRDGKDYNNIKKKLKFNLKTD